MLLKRNIILNDEKDGHIVTSLVKDLLDEPSMRDMLLIIGRQCPNYSILNSLYEQKTFEELIPFMTNELIDSLDDV